MPREHHNAAPAVLIYKHFCPCRIHYSISIYIASRHAVARQFCLQPPQQIARVEAIAELEPIRPLLSRYVDESIPYKK